MTKLNNKNYYVMIMIKNSADRLGTLKGAPQFRTTRGLLHPGWTCHDAAQLHPGGCGSCILGSCYTPIETLAKHSNKMLQVPSSAHWYDSLKLVYSSFYIDKFVYWSSIIMLYLYTHVFKYLYLSISNIPSFDPKCIYGYESKLGTPIVRWWFY